MYIRFLAFAALAMGLTLPGAAFANPSMAGGGMGRGAEASFTRMDTDKDGKVTREEFFAAYPQMKEGAFTSIDLDKDGMISKEEWLMFSKGHSTDEAAAHPDGAKHPPMMRGTNGTDRPAMKSGEGDGHPTLIIPKNNADRPAMRQDNGTAPGQAPDLVMPSK